MKDDYEIKIRVKKEEELYNELDEEHNTLSDNIVSYIEDNLKEKKILDRVKIIIKSDEYIDKKQIKKAFKKYINDKLELNEITKRRNKLKQTRLFIIGIIFIIMSIVVGKILDTIIYTIISTVGSFAIWEASDIWIIENADLKIENRKLKNLLSSQIEIETNNK